MSYGKLAEDQQIVPIPAVVEMPLSKKQENETQKPHIVVDMSKEKQQQKKDDAEVKAKSLLWTKFCVWVNHPVALWSALFVLLGLGGVCFDAYLYMTNFGTYTTMEKDDKKTFFATTIPLLAIFVTLAWSLVKQFNDSDANKKFMATRAVKMNLLDEQYWRNKLPLENMDFSELIRREHLEKQLQMYLPTTKPKSAPLVVILLGPKGSGKTTLVNQFAKERKSITIFVSVETVEDSKKIRRLILNQMGDTNGILPVEDLPSLFEFYSEVTNLLPAVAINISGTSDEAKSSSIGQNCVLALKGFHDMNLSAGLLDVSAFDIGIAANQKEFARTEVVYVGDFSTEETAKLAQTFKLEEVGDCRKPILLKRMIDNPSKTHEILSQEEKQAAVQWSLFLCAIKKMEQEQRTGWSKALSLLSDAEFDDGVDKERLSGVSVGPNLLNYKVVCEDGRNFRLDSRIMHKIVKKEIDQVKEELK
jgi:Cdc6-like AAA superfamily ATPase